MRPKSGTRGVTKELANTLASEQPIDCAQHLDSVACGSEAVSVEGDYALGERIGYGAKWAQLTLARGGVDHRLASLDVYGLVGPSRHKIDFARSERPHLNGIATPNELVVDDVFQLEAGVVRREARHEIPDALANGIE